MDDDARVLREDEAARAVEGLLRSEHWERRLAEARASRERALAGAPAVPPLRRLTPDEGAALPVKAPRRAIEAPSHRALRTETRRPAPARTAPLAAPLAAAPPAVRETASRPRRPAGIVRGAGLAVLLLLVLGVGYVLGVRQQGAPSDALGPPPEMVAAVPRPETTEPGVLDWTPPRPEAVPAPAAAPVPPGRSARDPAPTPDGRAPPQVAAMPAPTAPPAPAPSRVAFDPPAGSAPTPAADASRPEPPASRPNPPGVETDPPADLLAQRRAAPPATPDLAAALAADAGDVGAEEEPALIPPAATASPAATEVTVYLHAPRDLPATTVGAAEALVGAAGFRVAGPIPVDFPVSADQVRYYHVEDGVEARAIGAMLGAAARDFTDYRPSPAPGTVEVWLAAPE